MSDADEEGDRSEMDVSEAAGISDRVTWTLTTLGVGAAIQTIVHKPGFAISTTVDADGNASVSPNGDPPQNEDGRGESTAVLVSRLKQRYSKPCGPIKAHPDDHSAVDCTCSFGDETLNFQITRIETKLWEKMANGKRPEPEPNSVQASIAAVYEAFDKKNKRVDKETEVSRGDIILGLAADLTPRYATRAVADGVRQRHGREIAGSGFKEVWIIGPTNHHCYRLD